MSEPGADTNAVPDIGLTPDVRVIAARDPQTQPGKVPA